MASSTAGAGEPALGQVVACFGRRTLIETEHGETISCVTRARRGGIACGDVARFTRTSAGEGVIEAIAPRTSIFYRSDGRREKEIAANVTQVGVVLAVTPVPNADFTDRCLAATENAGTNAIVVLNKIDHEPGREDARAHVALYTALGYRCIEVAAHTDVDALRPLLDRQLSVLVGQSGVGKSTIVNQLVPDARTRVGEISRSRASGRHTTTHAQLHRIDRSSALIDSPGMQAFGLNHLSPADLSHGFVEFRPLLGECRFSNCRHRGEPGCAIEQGVREGAITQRRIESYRRILATVDHMDAKNAR